MSNVASSEQVTNKGALSRARRIVEEHTEVKVSVRAGRSLMSVADAQRRFSRWCV